MKFGKIYHDKLQGSICGLDRIRFRGTVRSASNVVRIMKFLCGIKVLLTDFMLLVRKMTDGIMKGAQERRPQEAPFVWLAKKEDKDASAKNVLAKSPSAHHGLICVFSTLECSVSPSVFGNKESRKLELKYQHAKCRHLYFHFQHPVYGFGRIRLQIWFPFGGDHLRQRTA